MKRLIRLLTAGLLVWSVLLSAGCLSAHLPDEETSGEPGTERTKETTAEPGTEPSKASDETPEAPPVTEPPTEPSTEAPTVTPTDPPATEPSPETTVIPEGKAVFFGRLMDESVAAVNARTLGTQGSGLYDVLASRTWLNEEVLLLIEGYTLPERPFYGARAVTPELREEILANRNTGYLSEFPGAEVQLRYGIICENASVRAFPTSMRACDSLDGKAFDYFQESMFQIGEGVLILHESLDQEWAFVQGPNYAGWVHEENIAYTSEQDFRSFLTVKDFAVVVKPGRTVDTVLPSGEPYQRVLRLGTILPLRDFRGDAVTLVFPLKNEVGDLETREITLPNENAFSAGFLPYSADELLRVARGMTGQPYGWGDEKGGYDCSSFVGLSYRCFGFFTPRNSSQFKYFGGSVAEVAGRETAWKYTYLEERPAAILAYPGHVMLYEKTEGGRHFVLHANTAYYDSDGTLNEVYQVAEAALEDLHRSDGSLLLDAVTVIAFYP